MTRLAVWWHGARPRTLSASVAPVLVGTAAAGTVTAWRFLAALLVGVGLQVAVNYANDYFDGVRGVDAPGRLGPPRLTSSGMASPRAVAVAAGVSVAVAGLAGLALAAATSLWLLPLGAAAMAALVLYSGGPRPYGALGLGEVMVFVFFGLLATAGSAYVQVERVPAAAWWGSLPMGLLAVAILLANNLRDIPTDAATGKRTLAVRLGDRRTRQLYRAAVVAAFVAVLAGVAVEAVWPGAGLSAWTLLSLAAAAPAAAPWGAVATAQGRDLIPVLTGTARLQATFAVLLAVALWVARAT